jgi:PAS domain S-box-containing protein
MSTDNTHRLPYGEIMVVEDNPSDLKFLSGILKKAGYQVRPASDGELALRSVRAKQPDLMMLDVNLPDMDGVEVCRRLKADAGTKEIPVIFISALRETDLKVKALEGGGVDYITKPIEPSEVLARIKTHLKLHRLQQRLAFQSEELIAEINERKRIEEKLEKHREHLEDLVEERTAALREREEKYRNLFESSFDGIAESSLEGNLLTCNTAYAMMTGYSEEELKKLRYQDLTPLKWAEIDKKHVEQSLEKGFSDLYEKERLRKDGKIFPISIRMWLRKDEQGNPLSLWGIVRDISGRKRSEKLLLENEKRFRGIIENTRAGYFFIDKDGLFQDINEAWLKMHNYASPDQIIGKHFSSTQIDMDIETANEIVRRLLESEAVPSGEFSRRCKDGSIGYHNFTVGPVVQDGKTIGIEGFIIDTTKRKQAEEALRESEKKYRSMMEAMLDAAYICSPEFRIEYMNPRMISRIGYDAVGESCHKAIYNNDEKCSWCVFDQIWQGEHVEYELADPKDNHYYSVTNSPILHSGGVISKLTIFRDITENKAIESQLHQARKMESIGTMVGGIAHDFNNLLYMITGNAELALEDIPDWNPVHFNLEQIKAAGLRAAGIVKQLLNFSRKIDPELRPIGAITVIKDTLKFLSSTIPSTVEIRKYLPNTDVTILADPIQINQIFMNLCNNASQAMEETGGILEINIENESLTEDFANNYLGLTAGEHIKITVNDTGPGIDPEIIIRSLFI